MRRMFAGSVGLTSFMVLICLCADSPTYTTSPSDASSSIFLRASSSEASLNGKLSTSIIDSVNKDIQIIVKYRFGYYIDSVHINIYSDSSFKLNGDLDSQFILRFDEDDIRDSSRFTIRFSTGGDWHFIVQTYKRQGNATFDTAIATIFSPKPDSNHLPVFVTDMPKRVYYINGGDSVVFKVYATDKDNDNLTYDFTSVTLLPQENEVLLGSDNVFRWKSEPGDKGIYHIVFRVSDRTGDTTITTTLVIDTTYNNPPLITTNAPVTAHTGMKYEYGPEAVDDESTFMSWNLEGPRPEGMNFDAATGHISWIPDSGVHSSGVLWLKVTDDGIPPQSDSQYILINVLDTKPPPTAKSRHVATILGTPIEIALSVIVTESSAIDFAITTPPGHGSAILNDTSILYTPDLRFKGVDTITFVAIDELLQSSDTATITIYVACDNQKPTATSQQLVTTEDTPLPLQLLAEDAEDSSLTYIIVAYPRHGTLGGGSSVNRLYTPFFNFSGIDSLTFIVDDGLLESDPATVKVTIISANDTPAVSDVGIPTPLNTPVTITLTVSDPDDSLFTYEIIRQPTHGSIDTSGLPSLRFIPATGFEGFDTVVYRVTDSHAYPSAPGRAVINVATDNVQPIAKSGSLNVAEDSSIAFELQGTDPEDAPLSFVITRQPVHGTLTGTDALRKYQPENNFWGVDTISFTVSDGVLISEPASMSITVSPVNDSPHACAITSQTSGSAPFTVDFTGWGWDADDDELTYHWAFGEDDTVGGKKTSFTYSDPGIYTALLMVSDGKGGRTSTQVTITVTTSVSSITDQQDNRTLPSDPKQVISKEMIQR